jgi:hypothetical protein
LYRHTYVPTCTVIPTLESKVLASSILQFIQRWIKKEKRQEPSRYKTHTMSKKKNKPQENEDNSGPPAKPAVMVRSLGEKDIVSGRGMSLQQAARPANKHYHQFLGQYLAEYESYSAGRRRRFAARVLEKLYKDGYKFVTVERDRVVDDTIPIPKCIDKVMQTFRDLKRPPRERKPPPEKKQKKKPTVSDNGASILRKPREVIKVGGTNMKDNYIFAERGIPTYKADRETDKFYQSFISKHVEEFLEADPRERQQVAEDIVETLLEDGYRFVCFREGNLVEIGDNIAAYRVMQVLRYFKTQNKSSVDEEDGDSSDEGDFDCTPLPPDYAINEFTIIVGYFLYGNSAGNLHLYDIVAERSSLYHATESKYEKMQICHEIVTELLGTGYKFVKLHASTKEISVLGELRLLKAKEHVAQAFSICNENPFTKSESNSLKKRPIEVSLRDGPNSLLNPSFEVDDSLRDPNHSQRPVPVFEVFRANEAKANHRRRSSEEDIESFLRVGPTNNSLQNPSSEVDDSLRDPSESHSEQPVPESEDRRRAKRQKTQHRRKSSEERSSSEELEQLDFREEDVICGKNRTWHVRESNVELREKILDALEQNDYKNLPADKKLEIVSHFYSNGRHFVAVHGNNPPVKLSFDEALERVTQMAYKEKHYRKTGRKKDE